MDNPILCKFFEMVFYYVLGDNPRVLSWEERLQIAHDVSHGIEYLHEGV